MADIIRGDKNVFHHSTIYGGVGSNRKTSEDLANLNFGELLAQLEKLKTELLSRAKSDDDCKAVAVVIDAKRAAEAKDGKTVLDRLKSAGSWVMQVARDIGVGVVVELMTKQDK